MYREERWQRGWQAREVGRCMIRLLRTMIEMGSTASHSHSTRTREGQPVRNIAGRGIRCGF